MILLYPIKAGVFDLKAGGECVVQDTGTVVVKQYICATDYDLPGFCHTLDSSRRIFVSLEL
jgi:hypothetical protein